MLAPDSALGIPGRLLRPFAERCSRSASHFLQRFNETRAVLANHVGTAHDVADCLHGNGADGRKGNGRVAGRLLRGWCGLLASRAAVPGFDGDRRRVRSRPLNAATAVDNVQQLILAASEGHFASVIDARLIASAERARQQLRQFLGRHGGKGGHVSPSGGAS